MTTATQEEYLAAIEKNRIAHDAETVLRKGAEERGTQLLLNHSDSLFDWLGIERVSKTEYWEIEDKQIKPAIENLGYHSVRFYTIDSDSFGPLVRGVDFRDSQNRLFTTSYS